ncbi:uncharacterized protein LOC100907411 [Galendromus occidentalis]|uniref:Uncharacterized protein LOC100907411 n=1 Tax=Galendromus occidentalis TaxID=34638 RepID=A0AAJ7P8Y3_9ACAR|nr:uncharacterized protein LOC100907411 [Galendromus occidentalis]
MVLEKFLHRLKISKRNPLMESDGDGDSVYSRSPSTTSSSAQLLPKSSPPQSAAKSFFWSSPLKRAFTKLVGCNKLAYWCRRSRKPPTSSPATPGKDPLLQHSASDDWYCQGAKQNCYEKQEQLIQAYFKNLRYDNRLFSIGISRTTFSGKLLGPTEIYAKPGSKIIVESADGRYFKVRIDVQKSHREKRCSTPTPPGFVADMVTRLEDNHMPLEPGIHQRSERTHYTGSQDACHQSSILASKSLTGGNIPNRHKHKSNTTQTKRRNPKNNFSNVLHHSGCQATNSGVFVSIREQYSSVSVGLRPDVVIGQPNHHLNCFSPGEHFICHYF